MDKMPEFQATVATPRPWYANYDGDETQIGSDDGFVAMTLGSDETVSTVEDYANAALIVRAVNAHDELLAAVQATENWLREYNVQMGPDTGLEGLHEQVRAALAKAEGR